MFSKYFLQIRMQQESLLLEHIVCARACVCVCFLYVSDKMHKMHKKI